ERPADPEVGGSSFASQRFQRALAARDDLAGGAIACLAVSQQTLALSGQRVVAPRRALIFLRHVLTLPLGRDEPLVHEPTQDRIDRAARQVGGVDDVEAVVIAARQCLEYEDG